MSAKVTRYYKRPDPDTVYEEDPEIVVQRDEKACCVCNSNNSICAAEQGGTYAATSIAAQWVAYAIF